MGELISWALKPLLVIFRVIGRKIFPIRFEIIVVPAANFMRIADLSGPARLPWNEHCQIGTATNLTFSIKAHVALPFWSARALYPPEQVSVVLVDRKRILGLYGVERLPGEPNRHFLGYFFFSPNFVTHFEIGCKPREYFVRELFPVMVSYAGRTQRVALEVEFAWP